MAYTAADLQMVDRHVAQGERHIVQQEELISRLIQHGLPTADAELMLADFHDTLRVHREHRDAIVAAMEQVRG
jgi:hypothetical protein